MSALRMRPGLPGVGDIRSGSYMLLAVEAKYDLLRLLREAPAVSEAFRNSEQCKAGSALHQSYEAGISTAGPVKFSVAGDHFSLTFDGS